MNDHDQDSRPSVQLSLEEVRRRTGISLDALRKRCQRAQVPGATKLLAPGAGGREAWQWFIPEDSLDSLTARPAVQDLTRGLPGQPSVHLDRLIEAIEANTAAVTALHAMLAERGAAVPSGDRTASQPRPHALDSPPVAPVEQPAPPSSMPGQGRPWWQWWRRSDA